MQSIIAWVEQFRKSRTYDTLVALPLVVWFGWGMGDDGQTILAHLRAIAAGTENTLGILQMLAFVGSVAFTLLLIVMLLTRTAPRARAPGIMPRALALIGTGLGTAFVGLHLPPVVLPIWAQALVDVLIFGASIMEIVILLKLGKSFAIIADARELVTSGPYAVVRHPLYVVEEIGILTMLIQFWGLAALALTLAHIAVQVARTVYEERILAETFPEYRAYQARTWRFIPHVI
ncbi:MAG: isoprenylcysteine carboxylmethyltransferase family protein [Rhizomicrobium sp.]|jgi:protein-S-isoprenylcysteine O-methyltransferase Ste14